MGYSAPKARDDLEYFEQVVAGEELVLVRDPVRSMYFRYNPLQAAMLRALDGQRSLQEITASLSERFEVEIPQDAVERFIRRVRELMLLDISAYDVTPEKARKQVRLEMRKAGFNVRNPVPTAGEEPRVLSAESTLFTEAFRQLDLGHPRAAAGYLAQVLARSPKNVRAKQLYELIQRAYIRGSGSTNETTIPSWMWVIFNPSRMLTWMSRAFGKFLFSWMGVLAILLLIIIAAYASTEISWDRAAGGPFNIVVMVLVVASAFLFHETGHGLACQHFGGNVTEIGFMFIYYVAPAAFCDTSSSYTIPNRRHLVTIQLAGIVASTVFMSVQAIILALLDPTLAIYPGVVDALILMLGSTFLNLNPFVQLDGYFAIADYFAFPNLRQRSFNIAKAWLSLRLLGLPVSSEQLAPRTRKILIAYAVASFMFTALFLYVIYSRLLAPIVETFHGPGLAAGVLLTLYLLRKRILRPIGQFFVLLVREHRRIFTLRRTAVLLAILGALIGPWFLRWPILVDDTFVVIPNQRVDVRTEVPGRVNQIFVHEGETVRRGTPLALLHNPELTSQVAILEAELETASHRLTMCRAGNGPAELAFANVSPGTQSRIDSGAAPSPLETGARPDETAAAEAELARIQVKLDHAREKVKLLTIRAPIDGVVATAHLEYKLQATLSPGDALTEIDDLSTMRAEIALAPSDPLAEIAVGNEVVLRPYGSPDEEVHARIERFRVAAQDSNGETRVVLVTSPFNLGVRFAGLTGHARIYGAEHSLAYALLYLPLQRLVRIRLWSL